MTWRERDCTCPRARHVHGTGAAYDRDGCRCFPCRLAHSHDHAAYRAGRTPQRPGRLIDSTGTRRRIEALAVMGHSSGHVAAIVGCSGNAVRKLRYGPLVTVTTATKIAAAYDQLSMTRNETRAGKNARTLALRAGFLPPLAWDDDTIDNPEPLPVDVEDGLDEIAITEAMAGRLVKLTKDERSEAVRRLRALGYTVDRIAERLGTYGRLVQRVESRRKAAA